MDYEVTFGDWKTEVESAAAFDKAVPNELFTVHREVCGTLIHPRPMQVERSSRIDRILMPTERLIDMGWRFGIIGVELKRSGEKIGPPIAQAMDYGRSIWTLEPSKFKVYLDYVFIWPMGKQAGNVASICQQNRIGSAYQDYWGNLGLKCGGARILSGLQVGTVDGCKKVGSR